MAQLDVEILNKRLIIFKQQKVLYFHLINESVLMRNFPKKAYLFFGFLAVKNSLNLK